MKGLNRPDGGNPVKKLVVTAATLLVLSAAPALGMNCCGGKAKGAMCSKGGMAMSHGAMKGKKGCCCQGMSGNMSKRG